MPGYFNPLQNYVPPAETLNAIPPAVYVPPTQQIPDNPPGYVPPSYIAPAPSLEDMYVGMQPYMQAGRTSPYDYYEPASSAAFTRYRHAVEALPRDMPLYDWTMNHAILANQLHQRAEAFRNQRGRYMDAYMDGGMLPYLMTRGAW